MTPPDRIRSFSTVIVGLVAGFLGALAAGALSDARQRPVASTVRSSRESRPASSAALAPATTDSEARRRIAALTGRLESLEHSTADASIGAHNRQTPSRAEYPQASAAQAAQEYDQFDGLVADHLRHPIELAWASNATQQLEHDLATIAQRSRFQPVDVSCRTDSCVVRLEWTNYRDAVANYRAVMLADYQMNCARSTSLRPPANPNSPYQVQFLFACSE